MFTWRGFCRVSLSVCALAAMALAPFGSAKAAAITRYVSTAGADASDCSSASNPCLTINYAIGLALAGDGILITEGVFTGSGVEVVLVNKSVSLSGGWNVDFTEQVGLTTIDGETVRRGMTVTDGITASLDRLMVQNGFHRDQGGGINNRGSLTISNSVITKNLSQSTGGGIFSLRTLVIESSTISDNTAGHAGWSGGAGGAGIMEYGGTLTVSESIISGNVMLGNYPGSAIDLFGSGVVNATTVRGNSGSSVIQVGLRSDFSLNNSTVSGNYGGYSGFGGIWNLGSLSLSNSTVTGNGGSGMANSDTYHGTVITRNSILAGNGSVPGSERDCGGTITSYGFNLLGSDAGCTFLAAEGDLMGKAAVPLDARLLPLDDYGGPTFTQALRPDSPAHGAGNPALPGSGGDACLATDQRGFDRIDQGPCDIGAYQIQRPAVAAIRIADESPTGAPSVAFSVSFTDAVTGVDGSDFQVAADGIDGAAVADVTGSGDNYTVSVDTGTGQGTIRLDLIDDDSIIDASGKPLGGQGFKNGDFRYGGAYEIDKIPLVSAVTRLDPDPTSAASVQFAVTFSRAVSGVDGVAPFADFGLTTTGVPGAAITAVAGTGADYVVSVSTGEGNGTIRLDVLDDDSIVDQWGNPLGGPGIGNGDFSAGEMYTVSRIPIPISPAGVITESRPTYTWNMVPGADRYQYELLQDGHAIFKQMVFADECGATTCSDTPPKTLKPGVYTWNVKIMIDRGWQEWGPAVEFTVVVP